MKTYLLIISCMLGGLSAMGQGKANLIVFSDSGDPFYLLINGAMQNARPETNVKVNSIDEGAYSVKVMFENTSLKHISKNAMIEPNKQYTFKVTTNRKGEKVMRFFGEVAMGDATNSGATEYDYSKVSVDKETASSSSTAKVNQSGTSNGNNGSAVTTTTTVTETTTSNGSGNESVSVDMNMGGINMGVNINVSDDGSGNVNSSSTTTTTSSSTTTVSSSTSTSGGGYESTEGTSTGSGTTSYGNSGCIYPNADMASVNKALDAEDFEDDKLALAKRVVAKKCLSSADIKSICLKFDFEDNRLDFAKYAYDHSYDPDNYYIIDEVFDFSDSKEELSTYINSK